MRRPRITARGMSRRLPYLRLRQLPRLVESYVILVGLPASEVAGVILGKLIEVEGYHPAENGVAHVLRASDKVVIEWQSHAAGAPAPADLGTRSALPPRTVGDGPRCTDLGLPRCPRLGIERPVGQVYARKFTQPTPAAQLCRVHPAAAQPLRHSCLTSRLIDSKGDQRRRTKDVALGGTSQHPVRATEGTRVRQIPRGHGNDGSARFADEFAPLLAPAVLGPGHRL